MVNSRDRLERIASGFTEARVLITAAELDLFTAVGDKAKSAATVAAAIGAHPTALERVLNALVAMKVLTKQNGLFRNSAAARRHLTADAPEPLGDIIRHRAGMWENWSRLTAITRTGKVPARKRTAKRTDRFIRGMSNVALLSAAETAAALRRELKGARRFLDVGGGPGAYACAFAAKHPQLRATVLDLPDVLDIAKETVAAAGLKSRVKFLPGDAFALPSYGRGYDVALLSNVVHCFKGDQAAEVIHRTARAVRRGGHVAVKEFCLEKEGTAPHFAALFSINMLTAGAGDSYPADLLKKWMTDAGLGRFRESVVAQHSTLLVGEKVRS